MVRTFLAGVTPTPAALPHDPLHVQRTTANRSRRRCAHISVAPYSDSGARHRAARRPQDVDGHGGELDPGVFEDFLQALLIGHDRRRGTKLGPTRPCSTSWGIHAASLSS